MSRFDGSLDEPTMIFDPPFGFLLAAEFSDLVPAAVGPCDPHTPNAVSLHYWR
jgi:hypothetical protein